MCNTDNYHGLIACKYSQRLNAKREVALSGKEPQLLHMTVGGGGGGRGQRPFG